MKLVHKIQPNTLMHTMPRLITMPPSDCITSHRINSTLSFEFEYDPGHFYLFTFERLILMPHVNFDINYTAKQRAFSLAILRIQCPASQC